MLTTTKRLLMRCIATLCVATAFLVRAEDADASIATQLAKLVADDGAAVMSSVLLLQSAMVRSVVGAPLDDDKGSNSGAVYVFEMTSPNDESSWVASGKAHRRRRSSVSD